MTITSQLMHLECSNCHERYSPDQLVTVCPACGKVLLAQYDLDRAAQSMSKAALTSRPWSLWRYQEILPVQDVHAAPALGEGGTPLLSLPRLGSAFDFANLMLKDEGRNPTGSFKARGLCMAVGRARELGAQVIAIPSAGNAASAMAAYAARAGIPAVVAMPVDAPEVTKAECHMFGAKVVLVDGLISDAGRLVRAASDQFGWFDVSTLKEPYRAEGKKTMGLELAEQLDWRVPDAIIYPTGGGTGIVGMWKAFDELESMGFIGAKRPRMVVVQADGCAPIVRAFESGERHAEPWMDATTVAAGLRVPAAIGDYLILDAIRASKGTALSVTDEDLLEGVDLLAQTEGLYVSPEAGAAVIASRRLREQGFLERNDEVVIFGTGAGVKHTDLVAPRFPVIDPASSDAVKMIEEAVVSQSG